VCFRPRRAPEICLRMFGTTVLFTDHIITVAVLPALRMVGH
jgi:hypothetical protein